MVKTTEGLYPLETLPKHELKAFDNIHLGAWECDLADYFNGAILFGPEKSHLMVILDIIIVSVTVNSGFCSVVHT